MTALPEYERLESTGVWRPMPDEQRRDVIVSVGDATLVIYDMADRAIAHWSLPAVERLNPTKTPAVYCPGTDASDELEIADNTMIDAIERVRQAIARRRPGPDHLHSVLLGGGLIAALALSVFWLPEALIRHTASVVPDATRTEIRTRLLANIRRVAGAPCENRNGRRALDRLSRRLNPDQPGRAVILASGVTSSAHLPGGLILLNRALVEDYEDPSVVAGYILAESARARAEDPIETLMLTAGPMAAFHLLTTGGVRDDTLAQYAEDLLAVPMAPVATETLLALFAAAGVPSTPYAYARDISGETTLPLIEADPVTSARATPVLPDSAWVSLQGICGE